MLSWLSKYLAFINLSLIALAGVGLGLVAAVVTGMLLTVPPAPPVASAPAPPKPQRTKPLSDYGVILERNIFNHAARNGAPLFDREQVSGPTAAPANLTLLGTVVADTESLALIRQGNENVVYRLDQQLPGGATLEAIERHRILLREPDGRQRELLIEETARRPRPGPRSQGEAGIRELGQNRWLIERAEVEKARGNLNTLLKSARMEPKIVNGRTEGFVVRMIRPRSLLDRLGLRRNDLVREVNGVSLDSPEKALQIFQQLREAKRIVVGLERRNQPITLEYTIE